MITCDYCGLSRSVDDFVPVTEEEEACRECAVNLYAKEIDRLNEVVTKLKAETVKMRSRTVELSEILHGLNHVAFTMEAIVSRSDV